MASTALPPAFPESSLRLAARMGSDPYGLLAEGRARFGDVFMLQLPGDPPRVVVCAPEDVRRVLTLGQDDYRSDDQSLHLNLGEHSVLFSDGDRHRRRRQLLTPPLHGPRLRSYADTMLGVADRHIDRLKPGRTIAARDLMRAIAMDVILECVFGVRGDEGRGLQLSNAMRRWLDSVLSPGMFMVSMALTANRLRRMLDASTRRSLRSGQRRRNRLLPWRRMGDAKAELVSFLHADVRRGRNGGTHGRDDVLALLLGARYQDGTAMDDDDIVDQLVTLLVGGHETTANTLSWTLHHLLRDPDALGRARAELREVFGTKMDPSRAGELKWMQACIVESMRLTPIAPVVSRTLTRPQRFGEWTVPASTVVWAGVFLVHHRADLWPHPERFDPARFVDAATPRPETFLPFGGGRRRCLGAAFAEFEMRIVLARLLERCELRPTGRGTRPRIHGITVAPSDGVPLRVDAVRPGA